MFVRHGKPQYEMLNTTILPVRGTSYGVKLRANDYKKLREKISNILLKEFNPAMLKGLKVLINNVELKPWKPTHEFQTNETIKIKNLQLSLTLSIMNEDIPAKWRHVQYQVWGKNITTKKLEWISEIKDPYKNRIHVMVDAEKYSKHLNLNKGGFKTGRSVVGNMYDEVGKWAHKILRSHGYIEKPDGEVKNNSNMTKFFQTLFKNPEFAWLNPKAAGGVGSGGGAGRTEPKGGRTPRDKPTKSTNNKKRGSSGFKLIITQNPNSKQAGWYEPEEGIFTINTSHSLFQKYKNNKEAHNQHVKSVVFGVLITNQALKTGKNMTIEKAFNVHTDLMTKSKNYNMVV